MDSEMPRGSEEGQGGTKVVQGWGQGSAWFTLSKLGYFPFPSSSVPSLSLALLLKTLFWAT